MFDPIDCAYLKKGYIMPPHVHADHAQILLVVQGRILLRAADRPPTELRGIAAVVCVPAGVEHSYEALEDSVLVDLRTDKVYTLAPEGGT